MMKRSHTGRILHTRRAVSTARPMHLTVRVRTDVPGLRRPVVRALLRELLPAAQGRGVRTLALAVMPNHLHWVVLTESAAALRDATRYLLGQFARRLNRLFGRRGPVFVERFWSTCCKTARQCWQALGYVLRNARAAGCHVPAAGPGQNARVRGMDGFTGVDEAVLGADRFLRAVLGPTERARRAALVRLCAGPAPFVPLAERLQARLPGL